MDSTERWLRFYKADVFTDLPFGGNPVAVFPDAQELTNRDFQQIARENESLRDRVRYAGL